jgi:FecR protein
VPLIILSLLSPSPSFAGESTDWIVRKTTGLVVYSMMGAEGVPVESGDFLAPGMSLKTADNGRARLERGEEWLIVLPNTLVTNLAEPDPGMDTTLKVEFGKIGVHVQKQSSQHFSVGAPNLVAVVKGTTFTVSADEIKGEVAVTEGLVEVTARSTREVRNVGAGQMASVKSDAGSLSVHGKHGDSRGRGQGASSKTSIEVYTVLPSDDVDDFGQPAPKLKKGKKGKGKGKSKGGSYGGSWGSGSWSWGDDDDDDDDDDHDGRGRGRGGRGGSDDDD